MSTDVSTAPIARTQTADAERIKELEEKLQSALNAVDLAKGIIDFCNGDAYERECTQDERSQFQDIYDTLYPPRAPVTEDTSEFKDLLPCHMCKKSCRGTRGLFHHSKSVHGYVGHHKLFVGVYRRAMEAVRAESAASS